jgi:simple sugar transport system substrate-binding protein
MKGSSMTSFRKVSVRAGIVGMCMMALLSMAATGCNKPAGGEGGKKDGPSTATSGKGTEPGKALAIGFIYVGPKDDYGYNQAHAAGAAAVKKMSGVKVTESERVLETVDVQKTMKSMIDLDEAKLIFPTSFGYFEPHVLEMAKKNPKIMFLHCGGLWTEGKHPKNVGSYFGYIDECEFISGVVAAHATKSKKLGFVAAKPIPQVRRNINAFILGARSVDPKITCNVVFTGDWSIPTKEIEATNSLIDQGVDVITCHVDSPKVVIESAEKRGIKTCGYHASQAVLAPKGYLTGAEWNWEKVYTDYVKLVQEGKEVPNMVRGGLKAGIVKMSPYTSIVSPEAKKAADGVLAQFMDDSFVIFKGPVKDNTGKTVIAEGVSMKQTDPELEKMDYLVEGAIGS